MHNWVHPEHNAWELNDPKMARVIGERIESEY